MTERPTNSDAAARPARVASEVTDATRAKYVGRVLAGGEWRTLAEVDDPASVEIGQEVVLVRRARVVGIETRDGAMPNVVLLGIEGEPDGREEGDLELARERLQEARPPRTRARA